jgi:ATP-dependent RNA helicase DeaD
MTKKLFSELGLSAELLKAIDRLGFEQASPIQAEAIPVLMQGKDAVDNPKPAQARRPRSASPPSRKSIPTSALSRS